MRCLVVVMDYRHHRYRVNRFRNLRHCTRELVEGHETVAHTARGTIKAASDAGDEGTADMVTGRLKDHEKTAWMLRSLLK